MFWLAKLDSCVHRCSVFIRISLAAAHTVYIIYVNILLHQVGTHMMSGVYASVIHFFIFIIYIRYVATESYYVHQIHASRLKYERMKWLVLWYFVY